MTLDDLRKVNFKYRKGGRLIRKRIPIARKGFGFLGINWTKDQRDASKAYDTARENYLKSNLQTNSDISIADQTKSIYKDFDTKFNNYSQNNTHKFIDEDGDGNGVYHKLNNTEQMEGFNKSLSTPVTTTQTTSRFQIKPINYNNAWRESINNTLNGFNFNNTTVQPEVQTPQPLKYQDTHNWYQSGRAGNLDVFNANGAKIDPNWIPITDWSEMDDARIQKIIDYQSANGLNPDGKLGTKTANRINGIRDFGGGSGSKNEDSNPPINYTHGQYVDGQGYYNAKTGKFGSGIWYGSDKSITVTDDGRVGRFTEANMNADPNAKGYWDANLNYHQRQTSNIPTFSQNNMLDYYDFGEVPTSGWNNGYNTSQQGKTYYTNGKNVYVSYDNGKGWQLVYNVNPSNIRMGNSTNNNPILQNKAYGGTH